MEFYAMISLAGGPRFSLTAFSTVIDVAPGETTDHVVARVREEAAAHFHQPWLLSATTMFFSIFPVCLVPSLDDEAI